jgi:hypothetical protein
LTVKLTREQRPRENLSVPNLLAQQLALCFYVAIRLSKIKTLFRRSVETSTLDWSAFDVHPEHQVAENRAAQVSTNLLFKSQI